MANDEKQRPPKGKKILDRLKDRIEGFVDDLKALLDPPQPVRVPVSIGPGRRR